MEAFIRFTKGPDTVAIYEIKDSCGTLYKVTHEHPNYSFSTWHGTAREAKAQYDIIVNGLKTRNRNEKQN